MKDENQNTTSRLLASFILHPSSLSSSFSQSQPFSFVSSCKHFLTPGAIVDVPADSPLQARFKIKCGFPSEFSATLGGVNRISPIVSRTVRHKFLQFQITPAALPGERRIFCSRQYSLQLIANTIDDLQVCPFVSTSDIVLLTRIPLLQSQ